MNKNKIKKSDVKTSTKKLGSEVGMEERIKSGEEIEVTEAVEILFMIKDNIPFEEISKKTGKPISDIEKIKEIFNA